jgi:hypothetical protein
MDRRKSLRPFPSTDGAEFGRITMDQMTRRAFGAAGFVLLLGTSATFAQQQSPTVRVRGTVEGVDGPMLTVKSRDGQTTYKVKMADNVTVRGIIKASLSDIKQNSFIGVTGMPQAEGCGNPYFPGGLAWHRRGASPVGPDAEQHHDQRHGRADGKRRGG